MAQKTLTIEQQSNVVNGFKKEPMNITGIPEGANVDGNLLHKLGTSIPTPFARLHLFDSAFKEVVDNQITDSDNNYFKLRDLGAALGITVDWNNETKTVTINSMEPPAPPEPEGIYELSAEEEALLQERQIY